MHVEAVRLVMRLTMQVAAMRDCVGVPRGGGRPSAQWGCPAACLQPQPTQLLVQAAGRHATRNGRLEGGGACSAHVWMGHAEWKGNQAAWGGRTPVDAGFHSSRNQAAPLPPSLTSQCSCSLPPSPLVLLNHSRGVSPRKGQQTVQLLNGALCLGCCCGTAIGGGAVRGKVGSDRAHASRQCSS